MTQSDQNEHGCGCCRRDFLGAVGMAAGGVALKFTSLAAAEGQNTSPEVPKEEPATVRVAFLYPPSDTLRREGGWWSWPGNDFNAEGRQAAYTEKLNHFGQKLGVRIDVDAKPLVAAAEVARFVAEVKSSKPDAVMLVPFHNRVFGSVNQVIREMAPDASKERAETGVPVVVYSCLGVKHGSIKGYQRAGVHFIQSLDNFEAMEYAVRMIRARRVLRESRILSVAGSGEPKQAVEPFWGTQVRSVPLALYEATVDKTPVDDEVKRIAQAFTKNAKEVREPKEADVLMAARVHVAVRRIMDEHGCNAIMMDCLTRGKLLPCMSFMTLRDEGIAAGCENDLAGTLTLMLVQQLFDRPGFQHNPCYETEANHYFASHCTSASKLLGTAGPQQPYLLRNYAHTNIPTCVPQVLFPEDVEVTMARYVPGKSPAMLVYSGKTVKSYAMPPVGGCRTNVEISVSGVADACDVKGHHDVLFCGDFARRLRQFCRLVGIKAVT